METVRIATPEDGAALAAIYQGYVLNTPISFEETPPSPAEMAARIGKVLPDYPFLVFEEDGEILAYAYASRHRERTAYRWACDVGVYAAPSAHRRGIGRRLYTVLLDLLRRQGFHTAHAGITLPNENSVGLHEAMGFSPVGVWREVGFKSGAWRDVGWWQRMIGSGPPTGEPAPFARLPAHELQAAGLT